VAESVCLAYNRDTVKKHLLRLAPEDHDELMTTDKSHKGDQNDGAAAKKSR
jgi:hypothetical protein